MAFAVLCAGAGRAPEASAACSGMPPSLVLGRTCWAGRRGRAPLLSAVSETIFNGEGISKPVTSAWRRNRQTLLPSPPDPTPTVLSFRCATIAHQDWISHAVHGHGTNERVRTKQ